MVPDSWGWRLQGWQGVGVLERDKSKQVVDVSIPADRDLTARRQYIIVYFKGTQPSHYPRGCSCLGDASRRTGKGEIQQVPGIGSRSGHPTSWMEGGHSSNSCGKSGNLAEL